MRLAVPILTKELDLCLTSLEQDGHIAVESTEGGTTFTLSHSNGKQVAIRRKTFYDLKDLGCLPIVCNHGDDSANYYLNALSTF